MPTRTRTVLFTDLAGYTDAVSNADREGLRQLLSRHEDLVFPLVRRHGGRVVKNLGDSFMCLFEAATDGLRAALDIQEAVVGRGEFAIRVGLNTGDVEEIDGDAFGDVVNQASRVLGKTPAGEVWFGPGTRACMNASEIPWEPVGRYALKGITGDVDIYRAVPDSRCWLPEPVVLAARRQRLVRMQRGQGPALLLPPDAVLLLEDFPPGSKALTETLDRLPVMDPASLFLSVYHLSPADRHAWTEAGRGLVIGTPRAIDRAVIDATRAVTRTSGADTIVLDGGGAVDLDLVVAGLALPSVPLSDVVASYFYDLLADGRWVNESDTALLRIDVHGEGVDLVVKSAEVVVDGRRRGLDEVVSLREGTRVEVHGVQHIFREFGDGYVGALLADSAMRLGVVDGQTAEVGREPGHPGLAFPDRRGQSNIRWCSGPKAARAKAGQFTLDRALAGRRQAAIALHGREVVITPLHDRCPTYVLRDGEHHLQRVQDRAVARTGDHLIAGTTVIGLRAPVDAW